MAAMIKQDHSINEVFRGGGADTRDMEASDTPDDAIHMRVLVDASDPRDVAAVNAIQDRMTIEAASAQTLHPAERRRPR